MADAYAAASSSVIPASWAAILLQRGYANGQASNLGIDYWLAGLSALAQCILNVRQFSLFSLKPKA